MKTTKSSTGPHVTQTRLARARAATTRLRRRLPRWLAGLALLAVFVPPGLANSALDGVTPPALTPGAPDGTYALSGMENINLYSGHMSFALPLYSIRGRGGAQYTMALPIDIRWATSENVFCVPIDDEGNQSCTTTHTPFVSPTSSAGFTAGKLTAHRQERHEWNGVWSVAVESLTTLKFTSPDGTEHQLRDTHTDGRPFHGFFNVSPDTAQPGFARGTDFKSFDGSSMLFKSDTEIRDFFPSFSSPDGTYLIEPSGMLLMPNGTRYRIDKGNVSWIRDANGNQTTFNHRTIGGTPTQPFTTTTGFTVTDSLQRDVTVEYNVRDVEPYGLSHRITYRGFAGAEASAAQTGDPEGGKAKAAANAPPRIIHVSFRPLSQRLRNGAAEQSSAYSIAGENTLFRELDGGGMVYNPNVVSTVWLPDGQRYDFYYNNYAELARVELPTGGAYEYDMNGGVEGGVASGVVLPSQGDLSDRQIYRRIVERRVYVNRTKLESKTVYNRPNVSTLGTQGPTEVVTLDPTGKPLTRTKHYHYGNAMESLATHGVWLASRYPVWKEGREYRVETYDAGPNLQTPGSLLRSVDTVWQQQPTNSWFGSSQGNFAPPTNPRIAERTTTLVDSGEVSKVAMKYSDDPAYNTSTDSLNNLTDTLEYDFGNGGAGPLLRHAHTDYLKVNPKNNLDYAAPNIYMLALPQFVKMLDGSGNTVSQTEYVYDEAAYPVMNYGATIPGWNAPETAARGNQTTTRSWLNLSGDGLTGPAKWVETHARYDQAGNVRFAWDALGNMTEIQFGAENAYAFPTLTKTAKPDPNGLRGSAAELTMRTTYDRTSGAVTSTTDANGNISTPEYNDPIDRLSRINRPEGGGWTRYFYGDAPNNVFRREMTAQDDLVVLDVYQHFDGLGRPTRSMRYEGQTADCATTWSVTDIQYDALGRQAAVSSPYRTCSLQGPFNPTAWTTTEYDALGAVKVIKTPDGAKTTTAHRGSVFMVTDPANRSKRIEVDALGRNRKIVEFTRQVGDPTVVESPQTGDHLTTYTYDELDNLRKVEQDTQTRTYVYDSLSRLRSAVNPESGTSTYEYYDSAYMRTKTDARGVVCTYLYDGVNRVLSRSYSDGTPEVNYTYDIGATNGLGMITAVSSSVSTYRFTEFDRLGRVKTSSQTTDGTTYGMGYGYDLAGHMVSQTYPSGRKVTTAFDAAGRIKGVSGAQANEPVRAYTSAYTYGAHGLVEKVKLGNGLWEQTAYNNRQQPFQIKLAPDAGGAALLQLDYDFGTTNNNGNTLSQKITVPTAGSVQGFTATQSYSYDYLNRLEVASETPQGGGAPTWRQKFTYDRHGNRRFDTTQTTVPAPLNALNNPTISEANNRIDPGQGYVYDDGTPGGPGNLTQIGPATRYTYDAENHITSYDKTDAPGTEATYSYDGDGRRVRKSVGGITTVFVYNAGGQLLAEYPSTPEPAGRGTSYLTSDNISSTRVVTDGSGQVAERHDYYPFGEEIAAGISGRSGVGTQGQQYVFGTPADRTDQKFTGKERDPETSLDYFGARYYSPLLGRFTSPDQGAPNPSDPQSWNRYRYARNNPLYFTDPDGNKDEPAKDKRINDALATDPTLLLIIKGYNNFSQRSFEDNLWSQAFTSMKGGAANILKGAAGEARAVELYSRWSPVVIAKPLGAAISELASWSINVSLPSNLFPDVGLLFTSNLDPRIPLRPVLFHIATGPDTYGAAIILPKVKFALVEVKSGFGITHRNGRATSMIPDGVLQVTAYAAALKATNAPGIAVLAVDAGAWNALSQSRRAAILKTVTDAGGYIQVIPNLAADAEKRAKKVVDEARRRVQQP